MRTKQVYLDYAATTPIDPRVLKAMFPYLKEKFGNSISLYRLGQESKKATRKNPFNSSPSNKSNL